MMLTLSQAEGDYASYEREHKMVTMFSGCRDDQTSADASIGGMSEGAMSWAFLETMKRIPNPTYLDVSCTASLFVRLVQDIGVSGGHGNANMRNGEEADEKIRHCRTRG